MEGLKGLEATASSHSSMVFSVEKRGRNLQDDILSFRFTRWFSTKHHGAMGGRVNSELERFIGNYWMSLRMGKHKSCEHTPEHGAVEIQWPFTTFVSCQNVWHSFKYVDEVLHEDSSFPTSPGILIWFSFFSPFLFTPKKCWLEFKFFHHPTGFASSTCPFWWAPCCRSSTLLPPAFFSSPPSWSEQDASPCTTWRLFSPEFRDRQWYRPALVVFWYPKQN